VSRQFSRGREASYEDMPESSERFEECSVERAVVQTTGTAARQSHRHSHNGAEMSTQPAEGPHDQQRHGNVAESRRSDRDTGNRCALHEARHGVSIGRTKHRHRWRSTRSGADPEPPKPHW